MAVIRVSGPAAHDLLVGLAGGPLEPRRAALRILRHPRSGQRLDQALVLFFEGPGSETGEDLVELQVHGGRAVIASVLAALGTIPGCRMAEPGEFARRAFANGKIDLTQAEGLADLIDAETEAQRRQALSQAGGALSRVYDGWRAQVIEASALVEAAIDFSDEADVSDAAVDRAEAAARTLESELRTHLADDHRGEILRDGFRIVLAGPPNAGKSSLLNALARRDVAIVSAEAGTTRDAIEVRLDLGGLPVILTDTAGLREATGAIEREGIRRTLERARSADLVIWLTDATAPEGDMPEEIASGSSPILRVLSKVDLLGAMESPPPLRGRVREGGVHVRRPPDALCATPILPHHGRESSLDGVECENGTGAGYLPPPPPPPHKGEGSSVAQVEGAVSISAVTGQGIAKLTQRLATIAAERIGGGGEAPVISQARHRYHVAHAADALKVFLSRWPPDLELRAEELRTAAAALGRITGRIDVEDVLDQVFSRFCIGK